MTVTLNITVEHPHEVVAAILNLAGHMGATFAPPAEPAVPSTPPAAEPVAEPVEPRKNKGRKAPAADAVIDQPKQTDIEEHLASQGNPANENAGERMLTVDDVRELTRQWASAGHMDEIAAEMTARGVKKMSEIDPEAGGKPSVKFGEYATAIEARIAAKAAQ